MGCSVVSLATIGRGCPDILVATPDGRNHLIEIKCGKNWTMTEDQKLFHATWRAPVLILDSVESAITWINSNGAT
jgi:hypothetical protein